MSEDGTCVIACQNGGAPKWGDSPNAKAPNIGSSPCNSCYTTGSRAANCVTAHYARPDVFRLLVNERAQPAVQTNAPAVFGLQDDV